jgi:Domain of unknown function (DUF1840)
VRFIRCAAGPPQRCLRPAISGLATSLACKLGRVCALEYAGGRGARGPSGAAVCHAEQTPMRRASMLSLRGPVWRRTRMVMIYKFKSGASGDVIMSGDRGNQLLGIIGKPPSDRGIVSVSALPEAILALEQAIAADDARPVPPDRDDQITLRQRAWPLVEMFKRARQADMAVVWGV